MNSTRRDTGMKSCSSRKKGRKKGKGLPTLASLRRKLDQVFSRWIRARDADENGMGRCITCNRWALLECGHFIPRQYKTTRWNELNAAGQCSYCNRWQHGAQLDFYQALTKKHGYPPINELSILKRVNTRFTRSDLEALVAKYSS